MNDGKGEFKDVIPTLDGGFIAVGAAYGSASGNNPPGTNQDVWVVKVDSAGCILPGCAPLGITALATNLTDAVAVYPNPLDYARGDRLLHVSITLPPSLKNSTSLKLSIVSEQGQLVQENPVVQGENTVNIPSLAAGVYYLHLTTGTTWLGGTKLMIE